MLAFLAIVADEDLRRGVVEPSYILCRTESASERTTGYVVVKANNESIQLPRLLFTNLSADNEFIHFLSHYRAREYNNKERQGGFRKKYTPVGGLFWFPCDEHGERDMTQPPVFIKRVPDNNYPREGTKKILEDELEAKDNVLYLLLHDPSEMEMLPIKKRRLNYERKDASVRAGSGHA